MKFDLAIFKAYDIRGIYPSQLNEETAYAFGRAYATYIKNKIQPKDGNEKSTCIAVGHDMRLSSAVLKERLIAGLIESGLNVDELGLVTTPTFYFATAFYGYAGGIQVSASHNPKEWNGFKVVSKNSFPIGGKTGLQEIQKIMEDDAYLPVVAIPGTVNIMPDVAAAALADQMKFAGNKEIKGLKVVIDGANGSGSLDMLPLFEKLPGHLIKMNFEPDGTFPVHEADPMKPENIKDLQARVIKEKADLGIAIDGDADRYFFVDEKGEAVPQAILRGLMAQIELRENPGATVAYDIRPGKITADIIEQNQGRAIVTPVGHSIIKEIMINEGAIFGGESSGHYFFKFPYGTFEAPIVLVLKLLQYLSAENKPFSEVLAPFKIYFHSGEINIKVGSREQAQMIIGLVKSRYQDGTQNEIDGISVEYPEFWFNIRASNTEPLLRFTIEAKTKKIMEVKRDEMIEFLSQF